MDIDVFESYIEETRRKIIAIQLLTFAYRFFKKTTIIQKKNELSYLIEEKCDLITELPKRHPEVIFDSLIDTIRICICFENYFKAKLLLNEFLIHDVKKMKSESLYKLQKKKPIDVKEITTSNSMEGVRILKDTLLDKTINYNLLLENPEYNHYFNINKANLNFLSKLNTKRNNLHLFTSESFELSKNILTHYKELEKIVDIDIAMLQRTLINEIDPESKSKIPVMFSESL